MIKTYVLVRSLLAIIEEGRLALGDKDIMGISARFFDDAPKNERILKYKASMKPKD